MQSNGATIVYRGVNVLANEDGLRKYSEIILEDSAILAIESLEHLTTIELNGSSKLIVSNKVNKANLNIINNNGCEVVYTGVSLTGEWDVELLADNSRADEIG